jgi:DNA repair protein RadC
MYKVKDLPSAEKPRERLIDKGPESLSDSELLAIILRSGFKDMNVFDISRNLVNEYGLKKLFELQFTSLKKIKGIGNSKACEIIAISEIGRRIKNGHNDSPYINYPKDAVALCTELQSKDKEHLIGLYLNTRHKVIEKVLLSIGNLDSSIVDPKEIYKHALRLNAHGVILLHNHP